MSKTASGNHFFKDFQAMKVVKAFMVFSVIAVCVLLSCGGNSGTDVAEDVVSYDPFLKGMTFAVTGNSISSYKNTQPKGYHYNYTPEKLPLDSMWWSLLAKKTGAVMIANSSWSGATVAIRTDKDNVDTISYFYSDNRVNSLARNGVPGAVFVLGGTNDWSIGPEFGSEASGFDVNTFYGAYSLMTYKIRTRYPDTRLYLCSILPRRQNPDKKNRAGWSMNQGNQAIKDIAQKYGAVYLDLSNCGLDRNLSLYTSDGLHPTAKGMELIADEMIRRLRAEKRNGSLIGQKH